MALIEPEEGFVWLQIPCDRVIEVCVIGQPESWHTHWYRGPESKRPLAVRCVYREEPACRWCDAGYERRVRYVLPVRFDAGVRLLELGRVQYPALACCEASGGLVGAHLQLSRERPYANAPIGLRLVGREVVPLEAVVDCGAFVAALGRVSARMLEPCRGIAFPEDGGNRRRGRSG